MGYYVYKHTAPNGKIYIGITQQRPAKRWGSGYNYDYNDHLFNAIKKYGWENFSHEILFSELSREDAMAKEIELIAFYDSANRNKGYNVSPGGAAQTDETKAKIQATREERKLDELQSQRSKERWADPEYREKTIKNMQGKVRTEESRERYRQATLRRGPLKQETIEKIKDSLRTKTGKDSIRKRPVLQIAPETMEVVGRYWTAREAAIAVGASINGIATVCRKKGNEIKASHGYFWCYEDEYTPDFFEQYRGVKLTESGKFPRTGERASGYGRHCSGEQASGYGRIWTDSAREKVGAAHSKAVCCIETGEEFPSIRAAAQKYGVDSSAIGNCLLGKAKTSCGYHWRYIHPDEART